MAACLLCIAAEARAQPRHSALRIIAPAAPGGGWDQTARVMQQVLQEEGLASLVTVENVPGAAGTIGLARFITADGIDRMEGQTLAEFLPGQKHVTIHIAFCPPFARCPTFESTTDAAGVRIGTTAIYPYGARLELKRLQEGEVPLQVAIVFEASLQPPESAAA